MRASSFLNGLSFALLLLNFAILVLHHFKLLLILPSLLYKPLLAATILLVLIAQLLSFMKR
ncbi:hypothetical protein [Paenibacillus sp.]|uniref:hypothetical protein n=1 Tax=Paenibacillus sp. TaxID=58172 RepID=UPI00281249A9|nr:hypothetical protein [Paenibacillus sp.]